MSKEKIYLEGDIKTSFERDGNLFYSMIHNGEECFFVNHEKIDKYEILAAYADEEKSTDNFKFAIKTLFYGKGDSAFDTLFEAIFVSKIYKMALDRKSELDVHDLFDRNYAKIGEGEIVKVEYINRKQPDSFVARNGEIIPVEMKLRNFNQSALRQLQGYIETYGAKRGIAVGLKCTVDLPDNIEFYSIKDLCEPTGEKF